MAPKRVVMLRIAVTIFLTLCIKKPSFAKANSCCYSFKGEHVKDSATTGINECLFQYIQDKPLHFRRNNDNLIQILLLISGDVELCPGPMNDFENEQEKFLNRTGMKCLHLNVRGLWSNFSFITEFLLHKRKRKVDIFSLTETHINDEPGELYDIDGYSFINKPRRKGKGGGVGIYISNDLNWIRREDIENSDFECIWIEIILKKSSNILLCVLYRPPDSSKYLNKNFTKSFNDMLEIVAVEAIVMGDFNVNFLKVNDHPDIKATIALHGYKQLLKQPTRTVGDSATLIDVILTNKPNTISATEIFPCSYSDHDMIGCIRKLHHIKYNNKDVTCRNYKDYDAETVNRDLKDCDWAEFYSCIDVNTAWQIMKDILISVIDRYAPLMKRRIKGKPCPWMTANLKRAMNERDYLLKKSRKSKGTFDLRMYKLKRNRVNKAVRDAKKSYHKQLLEDNANNPDGFWKALKKLFPTKSKDQATPSIVIKSSLTTNKHVIANSFNEYFSTIVSKLKKATFKLRDCIWIYHPTSVRKTASIFRFNYTTSAEVRKILYTLKRKKSTGLDTIPPSVLKDCFI